MKKNAYFCEIVLGIIAFIVIVTGLIMPKSGPLVLVDEFCDSLVIWIIGIIGVMEILRIARKKWDVSNSVKAARIFAILACILIGLWFSSGAVVDLVTGPETETLSNVQVSKSQNHTGIFSLHYYVTGTSSTGRQIRLEISGDDYSKISTVDTLRIEYYKNTKRIVRYSQDL